MTSTYWLGVVFAFIVLFGIFVRMRNQGMKERYATWWLVIAIAVAVISIFPRVLDEAAHLVGVQVPLNLAFFLAGVIMLLLSLRFSVDLSQSDEERRRLTEEIAFLRAEIDSLKSDSRTSREDSSTDPS
ncbi:DUF2304 domain-containing protein [uncultured Actinomyces sp.]|jgi:hypothetical protein|uniref:DUF2304 domain-containing protein n=1 Tax=uncultured Actinomyces sp. TaxID=249061 RepID=UPI0028D15026|nr:DUF2304 domain-containing protein [uncultured Actinomyces sp.]